MTGPDGRGTLQRRAFGPRSARSALTVLRPLRPASVLHPSPRAVGAARLVVRAVPGGATRISDLRQEGALKLLFPRVAPGNALEAVLLNTSGGLTGGDRMDVTAAAGPGARMTLTTQAAERAYRAVPGSVARVRTRLAAAAGATLHWLPQETIVFDGASLRRTLHVDLIADSRAVIIESLILGRRAMGEIVHDAALHDRWEVRRDGRLILADALRLDGDVAAILGRSACGAGAGAMATVAIAGPGAEARVAGLRALLPRTAGVSAPCAGLVFARILAADGYDLRAALIPVIEAATGRALPKVWRL